MVTLSLIHLASIVCSRYKIENCFGLIKQYERIIIRKDRKIKTFMSFIYIVCAIENNKIIKKLENNQ